MGYTHPGRHAVFTSPLACVAPAYLTLANTFDSRAASSHATGFRASCNVSAMDFKQGLPHLDDDLVLWLQTSHPSDSILSLSSSFRCILEGLICLARTGAKHEVPQPRELLHYPLHPFPYWGIS